MLSTGRPHELAVFSNTGSTKQINYPSFLSTTIIVLGTSNKRTYGQKFHQLGVSLFLPIKL